MLFRPQPIDEADTHRLTVEVLVDIKKVDLDRLVPPAKRWTRAHIAHTEILSAIDLTPHGVHTCCWPNEAFGHGDVRCRKSDRSPAQVTWHNSAFDLERPPKHARRKSDPARRDGGSNSTRPDLCPVDIDNRRDYNIEPVLPTAYPQRVNGSFGLKPEAEILPHGHDGGIEPIDDETLYELLR